ncbi:MAG: DUF4401 domain-containing protein [Betaproteobacteria bacterium]
MDPHTTWRALADAGLVNGEMPVAAASPTPWYLRALVGVAAWIAAVFVLSSMGALVYRVFDNAMLSIATGAILCAIATMLMRGARDGGLFLGQFGLAIAISGETLLALGVFTAAGPRHGVGWLVIAVAEIVLLFIIRDRTHRVIAAFFAAGAVYAGALDFGPLVLLPSLAAAAFAVTALNADRSAASHALLQPASAGIALALLLFAPAAIILEDTHRQVQLAIGIGDTLRALLAAVFVVTVAVLLRRARVNRGEMTAAMMAALILAAATWPVPGLLAALVVVVVGFAMQRHALIGTGLVSGVAMLGWYYFSLETTLMIKSLSLMAAGAILLATGWLLSRAAPSTAGARNA